MLGKNSSVGVIRTTSTGWLVLLAEAYKSKTSVTLIDDANLGVNPINDTLLDMGRKANLSFREWLALLIALGMGTAGAYLLIMAILDPEPYSKLTFAIGTGAILLTGGGFTAIRILVGHKPPNIEFSASTGFRISFS